MSNAIAAYGTLILRGASASGSGLTQPYATIGEVKNIKGPTMSTSVLDVTTHSSAASGNYREKVPSLIDPGTIEFELNYVPTDPTLVLLRADQQNRTKRDFKIRTAADAAGASQNITFSGYVTDYPLAFPTDEVMSGSLTITITGAVLFS